MSRCTACNKNLSDFEATRKIQYDDKVEYPDLCNTCFKESGLRDFVVVIERHDLPHETDIDDDLNSNYNFSDE